ncbi:MAG: fimbrillin family protein [Prevotella sp.]|nr:fimbrillin family protein [Prevotella sp.]
MTKRTIHRYTAQIAKTALIALPLALLSACQQSDTPEPQPKPQDQVPLQLTSGISTTITRAYDATWENNDKIGVFTVAAGGTTASDITTSGNYPDANIPYQITIDATHNDNSGATYATGSVASSDYNASNQTPKDFAPLTTEGSKTIYLPLDGSNVDVYAYYPFTSTTTPTTITDPGVTISSDQQTLTVNLETTQTADGQITYDLMHAFALSSSSPINIDHASAQLLFKHCLTKVLIVVKAGTGYSGDTDLANTSVTLKSLPNAATFLPLTQTLNVKNSVSNIIPYKLTEATTDHDDYTKKEDGMYIYRALVLPNTADGSTFIVNGNNASDYTRQIEITVGSTNTATYTYTINPTAYPFKAGEEIKFDIELLATGITITAAIRPWSEHSEVPEATLYETE